MDLNSSGAEKVTPARAERVIQPSPIQSAQRKPAVTSSARPDASPGAPPEDTIDLSEAARQIGSTMDPSGTAPSELSNLERDRREQILRRIGEGQHDWPESRMAIMKRLAREIGLLP